jgi:hypothetical protein
MKLASPLKQPYAPHPCLCLASPNFPGVSFKVTAKRELCSRLEIDLRSLEEALDKNCDKNWIFRNDNA